jgi:hypothetical protein
MQIYNKAITAFLFGAAGLLRDLFGIDIPGLSDEVVNSIAVVLTSLAVWLIPNRVEE